MNIEPASALATPLSDANSRQQAAGPAATATPVQSMTPRTSVSAGQDKTQNRSQQSQPPLEQIQQAMDEVREAIAPVAQNLLFSIDDDTGETIIKVVDAETDEVIRQIPSEEIVAIAKALDKLQGVLIKQEA